ncbi:MAG TPA: glutamine--tRNA ligase [Acidimicrobiaceae bacterium]|nr:glutamine--tRNA ligase [Acidimicrobiaceae bacterium]HCB36745.1 glutamine--tRNA ligase [Acidimicrobiaceae bacterium]
MVRDLVRADQSSGRFGGRVQTRFPPEPNGYLHIGHAKAVCLDFGVAREFGGLCNLRFDDTNPAAPSERYVDAVLDDIAWLGFEPDAVLYASDHFQQLYDWAEHLVVAGHAYVDDQSAEEISAGRAVFGRPGTDSPCRGRSPEENLALFRAMAAGDVEPGARVLRARIDMTHANMAMRDPVMYRVRAEPHPRTGDRWHVYPAYDWAHGQCDAIESVTHSLCTLEFSDNRAVYDWFLERLPPDGLPHPGEPPYQTEFARLELTHTVSSKRRLRALVDDGLVDGWDDPRLPTLRALRRRGCPAAAVREFCSFIGVTRTNSRHAVELLESFVRTELNATAPRRMAVLRPVRLVISNWPVDDRGEPVVEYRAAANNPGDPAAGTREVPLSGELWIERDDVRVDPPPKYYRLAPGREVRLRAAYFVRCTDVLTDDAGEVVEVRCEYDPATDGGTAPDGRRVKATIHWVSAAHCETASVALYERLFSAEVPGARTGDPLDDLNPDSRELITDARIEPALADTPAGSVVQFERLGYFAADDSSAPLLFHRTVGLRDEWANIEKRRRAEQSD